MTEMLQSNGIVPESVVVPVHRDGGVAANPWLEVRRDWLASGAAVCTVTGEIDAGTTHLLTRVLDGIEDDEQVRSVVVDLAGVRFLSVGGAELLFRAAGRAAAAGRELVLVLGTRGVRRALELTGADSEIGWYESRSDALEAALAWSKYSDTVNGAPALDLVA